MGDQPARDRLAALLEAYSAQGDHKTGTDVDARSGEWLRGLLEEAARPSKDAAVTLQSYDMRPGRLVNDECIVTLADGTRLEGRAVYNAASYADVAAAPLQLWEEEAESSASGEGSTEPAIGVIFANQGDQRFQLGRPGLLDDLRRSDRFTAYLFVYELFALQGSDQVAMMNADPYDPPAGCLAVQLPPSCSDRLRQACGSREAASISCRATFVPASSSNVLARVAGADPSLPPLLVMTPRSGWGACASERGPGLCSLVEALRAVASLKPPPLRTVVFVATSGHELGHSGLHRFLEGAESDMFACVHLGANFGSALPPEFPILYQASDAAFEELIVGSLRAAGCEVLKPLTPVGQLPAGEARDIHERGGQYVSVMGGNARFHHPTDTYPDAVDLDKTLRISGAVVQVVLALASAATSDLPSPAKSPL